MKKRLSLAILALLMLSLVAVGCPIVRDVEPLPQGPYPAPPKEWSQTFGGAHSDRAYSVQQTADGGFIIAGSTRSFGAGSWDFWLVKTDPQGNKEWSQTFGGPYSDRAYYVQQTACGGFIIAGTTESFGEGESDFWLVKTNTQGNKEWSRTFGGLEWEWAYSAQQTACGGFIIAGTTESFGAGEIDFWLVKTNAQGNKEWSHTFGGSYGDRAHSVQQTACGGFIIAGITSSFGQLLDFWLVKTDPQGNIEWSNTFGTFSPEGGARALQTACGGFIVAGDILCRDTLHPDFWLVKTDPDGNKEWSQTFGGGTVDRAASVQQTACGGFVIVGETITGATRTHALFDFWVVRTDHQGNMKWSQTFGGHYSERATSVQQTACGGFIIAGYTSSFGAGGSDFWLIKLAPEQ
ncbi:hypothetical protein M1N79_01560 [Dehalococcoidia bacterium]|nr:hypothetical protein [Dehalococcoidia bacterium]